MKKLFRQVINIVLCIAIISAMGSIVGAREEAEAVNLQVTLAHLDDEQMLPPQLREQIIEAREIVAIANFEAVAPIEVREYVLADDRLAELLIYAYLDIDFVSPRMRNKILDARYEIVDAATRNLGGWFNDELVPYAYLVEPKRDSSGDMIFNENGAPVVAQDEFGNDIRKELPAFSELFPGWEVPVAS